jgi:hypothetical protein
MRTLLGIIRRRWIVVIPTLALVIALGFNAASGAAVRYEAKGSTLLLAPNNVFEPTNPYADYNPALLTTANALQRVLGQPAIQRGLQDQGLSNDYNIIVDEKAPILGITATASTADLAMRTVDALQTEVTKQLTLREDVANAGPLSRIGSDRIVVPNRADKVYDDRNRAIVVVVVLGLLAVCAVAVIAEGVARRRPNRSAQPRPAPSVVPWEPALDPRPPTVVSTRLRRRRVSPEGAETPRRFADPVWPENWPEELEGAEAGPQMGVETNGAQHETSSTTDAESDAPGDVGLHQIGSSEADEGPRVSAGAERPARNRSSTGSNADDLPGTSSTGWLDSVTDALDSFSRRSGSRRRMPRRSGEPDEGPTRGSANHQS